MRTVVPMWGSLNVKRWSAGCASALTANSPLHRINMKNTRCFAMLWSIPHMSRPIKHALRWIPACVATAFCLGVVWQPAAPGQVPDKLPVVEKATHKSYVEKLTDDVSFEMLPIPGGVFAMGSPDSEKGRGADEGPQHPVQVKPFWMGKLEVRWDEYDLFWLKRPGGPPPRPDVTKKPDKLSDALTSPT